MVIIKTTERLFTVGGGGGGGITQHIMTVPRETVSFVSTLNVSFGVRRTLIKGL